MFKRTWVLIPGLDTGWTFFHIKSCKICTVCLERPKLNGREAWDGPFLKNNNT